MESNIDHSHALVTEATKLLSSHFQSAIAISKVSQLSEPDRRNLLLRLDVASPSDKIPRSVILKKTALEERGETEQEQMSRFAHDWAGIEFLTQIKSHHAPYFYGGSIASQFILVEDLGLEHHSLVGPLTRKPTEQNSTAAQSALALYIQRLGRMHADTFGKTDQFETILHKVYPNALRFCYHKEQDLNKIIDLFQRHIGFASKALTSEIENIITVTQAARDFKVLLHGDICPDNVFFQNAELRIFDFEYCDTGFAFIDGVYLRMSMPSCWCSKSVPESILANMEQHYHDAIKTKIVAASDTAQYNNAKAYGCAYWLIWNLNRWIDELLDHEWNCPSGSLESDSIWDPEQNTFRPRILSRVQAFIESAEQAHLFPALCEASKALLAFLRQRWPKVKALAMYPVFTREAT